MDERVVDGAWIRAGALVPGLTTVDGVSGEQERDPPLAEGAGVGRAAEGVVDPIVVEVAGHAAGVRLPLARGLALQEEVVQVLERSAGQQSRGAEDEATSFGLDEQVSVAVTVDVFDLLHRATEPTLHAGQHHHVGLGGRPGGSGRGRVRSTTYNAPPPPSAPGAPIATSRGSPSRSSSTSTAAPNSSPGASPSMTTEPPLPP